MGELSGDERGESEALFLAGGMALNEKKNGLRVRREAVFRCLTNLSIVTGAVSIAFIVFIALVMSNAGYILSASLSVSLAILYLAYRIVTESVREV